MKTCKHVYCHNKFKTSSWPKKYCSRKCKEKATQMRRYRRLQKLGVIPPPRIPLDEASRKAHCAFNSIKGRCENPNHQLFHRYGARGIRMKFTVHEFTKFFLDATYCKICEQKFYSKAINRNGKEIILQKTIHRIDGNSHYEPSNIIFICRSCHSRWHIIERRPMLRKLLNSYVKYLLVIGKINLSNETEEELFKVDHSVSNRSSHH